MGSRGTHHQSMCPLRCSTRLLSILWYLTEHTRSLGRTEWITCAYTRVRVDTQPSNHIHNLRETSIVVRKKSSNFRKDSSKNIWRCTRMRLSTQKMNGGGWCHVALVNIPCVCAHHFTLFSFLLLRCLAGYRISLGRFENQFPKTRYAPGAVWARR